MQNRTHGTQKSETDDIARTKARATASGGEVSHAPAVNTPGAGRLQSASPQNLMRMQNLIGNSAVQRLLIPTSIAPHAPACTCPGCSSHIKTVTDDEPHAPAPQQSTAAPTAPSIQREGFEGEEEVEEAEVESYAEEFDNAVDSSDDSGAGDAGSDLTSGASGTPETGVTMSVQEDFVPLDMGGQPDMGLEPPGQGSSTGEAVEEQTATAVAPGTFTAGGQTGTAPVKITDKMPEDGVPHAFTNGGQTGTVAWAGGGGAGPRGNQGVGSMQTLVPPTYSSGPDPATAGAFIAWIDAGTGRIDVTRSYLGAITGNQGNGQYVSAGAAARLNAHEMQHVTSTSGFYSTHIAPMLVQVAARYPGGTTTPGATAAAAIATLQTTINWAANVAAFQTNDTAANTPMGTVDTADLASGTYPEYRGPGAVAGTNYVNRLATPGEVLPP